jgi:hypothetical protein
MRYEIRKLGVGGILDQTINVVKDNFGLLFTIYAVTLMPFNFLHAYVSASFAKQIEAMQRNAGRPGAAAPDFSALEQVSPGMIVVVGLGALLLLLLAYLVFNAATIHGVASMYISRPTSLGDCIKTGFRRFFPMLWTGFLMGLAVAGAALITVGVGSFILLQLGLPLPLFGIGVLLLYIPILILIMWWILAQEITVLEHISGSDALGRSKKLMRGNLGKAFVILLILGVINAGLQYGVAPFLSSQPLVFAIVATVVGGASSILGSAVLVILYFSARCEHENFDLQMLTSAVAEDFESPR